MANIAISIVEAERIRQAQIAPRVTGKATAKKAVDKECDCGSVTEQMSIISYYVDEAGDGVLFGPKGRNRLADVDASKFFMLGMVCVENIQAASHTIEEFRKAIIKNPLYASIPSLAPERQKTAIAFHAKDDHPEIKSKLFENLTELDFKFFAVIKDMRKVAEYVKKKKHDSS